ncbi:MAG: hypothetical protein IJ844_05425 [Prevotella sp.]|nr:hypothetical protein [Prevotella sp.]
MKTQLLFRTLLAILFACFSFQYSFSQTSDLEKEIEKGAEELNQQCPYLLDEQSNMYAVQVRALPQGIIYEIALSSAPFSISYFQVKSVKKGLKKLYIGIINANPQLRKYVIENDKTITYRIHHYNISSADSFDKEDFKSDNHEFFDVVIKKNDLKKRNR